MTTAKEIAEGLQRETLHGPVPMESVMALAQAVIDQDLELELSRRAQVALTKMVGLHYVVAWPELAARVRYEIDKVQGTAGGDNGTEPERCSCDEALALRKQLATARASSQRWFKRCMVARYDKLVAEDRIARADDVLDEQGSHTMSDEAIDINLSARNILMGRETKR